VIKCANSIIAASAARGFRRTFGTGKSLSFVEAVGKLDFEKRDDSDKKSTSQNNLYGPIGNRGLVRWPP
jgi:hypothetical protein